METDLPIEKKAKTIFYLKKKYIHLFIKYNGECQYCNNELAKNYNEFVEDRYNGQIKKILPKIELNNKHNYTLSCKRCKREIERHKEKLPKVSNYKNSIHLMKKTFSLQKEYVEKNLGLNIEKEINCWENQIEKKEREKVKRFF